MFDADPTARVAALLDALAAGEARIRALQARQLELVAAFAASQREEFAAEDGERVERAVALEVAGALGVSITSARMLVCDADALSGHHPHVLAALRAGQLGMFAARQLVAATRVLPDDLAGGLDEALAVEAAQLLPGQVRPAADARVAAADPEAAARRANAARADRRVWLAAQPDAVATLGATLPAEQALACYRSLDDYARGRRADGDDRTIDRIMCDTLVERVTGAASADAPAAVELQVVITDLSLLGRADAAPASLAGFGPVPADVARRLSANTRTAIRRLLTDPIDATVTATDTRRRRFDGPLRDYVIARDRRCRNPRCDAPIRDLDHRRDHADGGPTSGSNGDGYCQRCHHLKDHSAIAVGPAHDEPRPPHDAHRITWHGPSGRTHNSLAPPALGHGAPTLHQLKHRRGLLERELEPT